MDETAIQLFYAAKRGDIDATRMAIRVGADINARNEYQETPLHMAAMSGNVTLCKLLIESGANVDAVRVYDCRTPMDVANEYGNDEVVSLLKKARTRLGHADRVSKQRENGPRQPGG